MSELSKKYTILIVDPPTGKIIGVQSAWDKESLLKISKQLPKFIKAMPDKEHREF